MIQINAHVCLDDAEIDWQAIKASGPGGQHVNKTSTAMQLMFDIRGSSLPEHYKTALLARSDHRITASGKIIIKCQASRSQEMNRQQALQQFMELIASAGVVAKKRRATKPTFGSQQRRLDSKKQQGSTKALRRQKPSFD
jgi:ribosome-associated protein